MSVLHAFLKRHALGELIQLSTLTLYGYLFAALAMGLAIGVVLAVLA